MGEWGVYTIELEEFGIGKSTSRRLLCQMEEAQLISIQWHTTRAPEVTFLLDNVDQNNPEHS